MKSGNKIQLIIWILLLSSMNYFGCAQVNRLAKIEDLFNHLGTKTPGAVITIVQNDSIVYTNGFGMANLAYNIPMTSSTLLDIGSCAKTFTAFAILLLVEEGKISLDDDIRRYIPELPDYGQPITVRHLGTHTSGIREWIQLIHLSGYGYIGDPKTKQHLLNLIFNQEGLNFIPGEKFNYSNSNYLLLAEIVERVSGKSFARYTRDNIFNPLEMYDTYFYDDYFKIRKNAASRYLYKEQEIQEVPQHHAAPGDGSLYTTAKDMGKWLINFNQAKIGNPVVFSTLNEQMKLKNGNIISSGFGQYIDPYMGMMQIQHSGDAGGINSYVTRFPEKGLSIFVSCNDYDCGAQFLALKIVDIYLNLKIEDTDQKQAKDLKTTNIDLPKFKKFAGHYWSDDVNLSRKIKFRADSLFYIRSNGNESLLIPSGENEFTFDGSTVEAKVWFEVNSNGQKAFYYQYQNDQPNVFLEYMPKIYNSTELNQFIGIYYSQELRSIYEIKIESGELIATHFRKGNTKLLAVMDDLFSGSSFSFGQVEFIRNEDKIVDSFKVSSRNARGIIFRKIVE